MAKKILTSLDLRGDILINGTANTTSGNVLTSNGAGGLSWAAASGGGGSGFTGAGTSITGIAGTNVNGGSGSITGSNIILTTGTAITNQDVDPEIGNQATSGNLYLKSGDATGFSATSGNVYIETGQASANGEYSTGVNGNVLIGGGNTKAVGIGWTDTTGYTLGGAVTVNIIDKSSTTYDKVLNLAPNGNSTINIGTNATGTRIKLGVGATTTRTDLGNKNTSSTNVLYGKNLFWQPTPGTAPSNLSATDLQKWILTTTSTSGNIQLPSVANMETISSADTDIAFEWSLINTAASGSVTITAQGAHTIVGNAVVTFGTSARYRSRRVSSTQWITYRIS
jgi:hypothetical protein